MFIRLISTFGILSLIYISAFCQDSSIQALKDICGSEYNITRKNDCFVIMSKEQYLGQILTPCSSSAGESMMLSVHINLCPIAVRPYETFVDIAEINKHLNSRISVLIDQLNINGNNNTKDDPLDNLIPLTIKEKYILLEISLLKTGIRPNPTFALNSIAYWLDVRDIIFDDDSVNDRYSLLIKNLSNIQ